MCERINQEPFFLGPAILALKVMTVSEQNSQSAENWSFREGQVKHLAHIGPLFSLLKHSFYFSPLPFSTGPSIGKLL